ncbi:MAG: hypothetical protein K2G77_03420, partial [Muribaculaceae bacterium]|nr:hypothetical protein [Muribaculaceae bacterium]
GYKRQCYNVVQNALGENGSGTKMEFQSKMNSDGGKDGDSVASKFAQGGTNFSFAQDPVSGGSLPDIMPDGVGDVVPF